MKSFTHMTLSSAITLTMLHTAVSIAAEPRLVYGAHLIDPAAASFDSVIQLTAAKALLVKPTSALATGQRKFDAKSADAKRYPKFFARSSGYGV